jgi:hypothetical protein
VSSSASPWDTTSVPPVGGSMSALLSTWPEPPFGLPTRPLGEAVSELEASTESLDGRVRIEVLDGLD